MRKTIKASTQGAVTTIIVKGSLKAFVTSDVHFDSISCNRWQFFKDMDIAMKEDAQIFIVGDFFDAMNGRFDPRRSLQDIRPEYRKEDYYDALVKDAAKHLMPYVKNIAMISTGNHELAVLKNANTNLTERLVTKLRASRRNVQSGGYGGIILVKDGEMTVPIKYYHGSGGEAPVTRGAIQTNRQAVFLPDFQLVLNGHSHHAYWIPIVRERVTKQGKQFFDIQHHVRTPGYQMNYGDGSEGWEVTRGGVPKPVGSCFVTINRGEIMVSPLIHVPKPIRAGIDLYDGIEFPQE